jgi:hypothetical protein
MIQVEDNLADLDPRFLDRDAQGFRLTKDAPVGKLGILGPILVLPTRWRLRLSNRVMTSLRGGGNGYAARRAGQTHDVRRSAVGSA